MIDRRSLRWVNALGFALTFFFALWLLVFVLLVVQGGETEVSWPVPPAFLVVGGLSLVVTVVLFAVVLFRYAWHGVDLSEPTPHMFLYGWTCAGAVFFVSQLLAMVRFGSGPFPHLPDWLSSIYWYLAVIGALVFAALMWVNSDHGRFVLMHGDEHDEHDDDHEDWDDEDAWDDEDDAPGDEV